MHNNPFSSRPKIYSTIKRNRIIRSQKKFTEVSGKDQNDIKEHFKTQIQAIINSTPGNQNAIISCIDQLKQKLLQMKGSPKRKVAPQHQFVLYRKNSQNKQKKRSKTYGDNDSYKMVSKSMNFMAKKNSKPPSLMDLQEIRNQVKRQKQISGEKRIPTDNQRFRYQQFFEGLSSDQVTRPCKKNKYSSEIKLRSNTEDILKSTKCPQARHYHYYNISPRKICYDEPDIRVSYDQNKTNQARCKDNNLIKQSSPKLFRKSTESRSLKPVIDNNDRIGDISTIVKQKETLNFLGQSCVGINDELSPKKDIKSSKLLDFVDWRTNELKNAFSGGKQKKRKTGLQKLSKIFPKGFFVSQIV